MLDFHWCSDSRFWYNDKRRAVYFVTHKVNLMQSRYLINYICIEQIKIRIAMKMSMPQTTRDKMPIMQHNWFGDPKPNSQNFNPYILAFFGWKRNYHPVFQALHQIKLKIYRIVKCTTGTLQTSDGLQVLNRAIGTETSKL